MSMSRIFIAFDTHFIHILWSLRRTQVSSAFLFGSAYMHILFSGFYVKEDGTSTPRPSISVTQRTAAQE
jgi:hypothetical protein